MTQGDWAEHSTKVWADSEAMKITGPCTCHEGYKSRNLVDPECIFHECAEDLSALLIKVDRAAHRRGMEEAAGICEGHPLDPNDGVGYFITDGIHGDWARDSETARVRRHCATAIRAAIKESE